MSEAKSYLAKQGVVEFNLIAQDLTAYGYDLRPRSSLTALLEHYLTWMASAGSGCYAPCLSSKLSKGLIELMAREPKITPYLDMPLQHISDNVLKRMKLEEQTAMRFADASTSFGRKFLILRCALQCWWVIPAKPKKIFKHSYNLLKKCDSSGLVHLPTAERKEPEL